MAIPSKHSEIASPSIDTDRYNLSILTLSSNFQAFQNVSIKLVNIPVIVPSSLNQMIREAVQYFLLHPFFSKSSKEGTTTGCPQIDSKKTLFHIHLTNLCPKIIKI